MDDAEGGERSLYWERQNEVAQKLASEFVGKSADGAAALASTHGLELRLIDLKPDGTTYWTQEYVFGRVTVFPDGGVVTESMPG